jgi:O-antigen ligase
VGDDLDPRPRIVPVAAKAFLLLALLAALGGAGAVYAPVPTFILVAAVFAGGLWWFVKDMGGSRVGVAKHAEQRSKGESTLVTRLVSGFLLVWWAALIAPIATYAPRGSTSADVAAAAAQGSLRNQLLVISFGVVGALFVPAAMKRFDSTFQWVAALWVLYLGWALASLSWSIYLPLTIRNVGALILVSVGAFGLGGGFYGSLPNGRDLFLRHVFAAGILSALVVVIPLPLHWDEYALLDPSQRLSIGDNVSITSFVVRPVVCALLVLLTTWILQLRRWQRIDWFWVVLLLIPLMAVKARGPVLWGMLALVVCYLAYRSRLRDRVLQVGLLVALGTGAFVFYSEGVASWLWPYLTRGSVETTMNLTGRVPLWQVLLPEVAQHPWLGVGFAAYWSPSNVYQIEQLVGFPAVSAHNGFLEELLNTGIVGLAILLSFYLYGMVVGLRQARLGDPLGWLALLFVLYYLLLNVTSALMQQYLEIPSIIILAIFALMASKPKHGSSTLARGATGATPERVSSPR